MSDNLISEIIKAIEEERDSVIEISKSDQRPMWLSFADGLDTSLSIIRELTA